jgi:hypothetical protein
MTIDEDPKPTVSGLTMEELVELIDSLEPYEVGVFGSFEALVRHAEGRVKTRKMEPPAPCPVSNLLPPP